jgi:hypothetical protein
MPNMCGEYESTKFIIDRQQRATMQSTTIFASSPAQAFRLTSKSPSELMHTLGPHGVDELIRQMLAACWRDSPAEGRTHKTVQAAARVVFDRNLAVWKKIKKPSPAAFFENLLPHPADGHLRQAMVLCWMMMPRGKRGVTDVGKVVTHLFERNLAAWDEDYAIFTKGLKSGKVRAVKAAGKKAKRR